MTCAPLIMLPLPSPVQQPFRFVIAVLLAARSGRRPRPVKRPDVKGVDLPSAQTVTFIPRSRGHDQRYPSLFRDILSHAHSHLQEEATLISAPLLSML